MLKSSVTQKKNYCKHLSITVGFDHFSGRCDNNSTFYWALYFPVKHIFKYELCPAILIIILLSLLIEQARHMCNTLFYSFGDKEHLIHKGMYFLF